MYHCTSEAFWLATVVMWNVLFPPSALSDTTLGLESSVALVGGPGGAPLPSGPKFSADVGSAALAGVATRTKANIDISAITTAGTLDPGRRRMLRSSMPINSLLRSGGARNRL